ncbi:inositol monophosphatase family protein [Acidihalobacter ferrooxydans]|uniref:Inositol-1-monophosphatase n=1 Tax=Acidihalobacter ferrooxydans TaxID=1765967 RepID=A0A1P8UGU8_9GAMM|nr:inositol monophosphatase family protein [Acidihalobacter ferrooxydans]APZ43055.1 inositol monophosphatase [Acidihalobacter ferrooxydans]
MHPFLNTAVKAARIAGSFIQRHADRLDTLTVEKKQRNDFVSEVDRQAEDSIIRTLRKAYPSHAILAEESGHSGDGEYQWIIDPLDGTTNYLHGIPHYAVSIALRYRNRIEHAVVYDPAKDEMFSASRGAGATLNNRRIRVSSCKTLEGALLGTGIPFREDQDIDSYMGSLRAFLGPIAGIRRPGSAALDLAYVAAGRFDGYWEAGLHPWDIAAGVLLVREAGGLVTDFEADDHYLDSGNVIAASPKLLKPMLAAVHPHLGKAAQKK